MFSEISVIFEERKRIFNIFLRNLVNLIQKEKTKKIKTFKMMYFGCDYKYAICIDMVTTCWDTQNLMNADAIDRQEIIGKLSSDCNRMLKFRLLLSFFPPKAVFLHTLNYFTRFEVVFFRYSCFFSLPFYFSYKNT